MTWKPRAEKDVAVKAWMKARGGKVDDYENNARKPRLAWLLAGLSLPSGADRDRTGDPCLQAAREC
jgi:hypothetical protein